MEKRKNFIITTEDRKMIKVSKLMSITSVQLCDFLVKLNEEKKIFHPKKMRKIIKYFRENKNITKKKYKKMKYRIDSRVKK